MLVNHTKFWGHMWTGGHEVIIVFHLTYGAVKDASPLLNCFLCLLRKYIFYIMTTLTYLNIYFMQLFSL